MSTGSDVTKINANIRKAMQNIDYDLKDLKDVLPKLRAEMLIFFENFLYIKIIFIRIFLSKNRSDKDIARRRDECDQLISEKNELMRQFQRTQTPNLYNRDPIEEYDRNKMGEDPEHLKNLESQQVLDYQRDVIKKQDEGLDRISQALDRTKQIGMSISDELDEQNVLLDKLDDDVDGTSRVCIPLFCLKSKSINHIYFIFNRILKSKLIELQNLFKDLALLVV